MRTSSLCFEFAWLVLAIYASAAGEAGTQPAATIYDKKQNPEFLGLAEVTQSKLGAFIRDAQGMLVTANVPDTKPSKQGSMIYTGTIGT